MVDTRPDTGLKADPADDFGSEKPVSVFRRRFRRFRRLRRGWYSFLILVTLYVISFFNPLLINNKALIVHYEGKNYFPAVQSHYDAKFFGQKRIGEVRYRELEKQFQEADEGNWVLMPPYPYHPNESLIRELVGNPPHPPSGQHWLGTDDRDRDVLARLAYGFHISLSFALGVVSISYALGVMVGSLLGFFGGRVDMFGQRFVEIWAGLPFLYTVMIVASVIPKVGLGLLTFLVAFFSWVGITYYMRGEFYREKAKDYVSAAISQGESRPSIMFRHILPNTLTPIVSFAPFALVGAISAIVSLDFLGFGLPAPTPSWGELMDQGLRHLTSGDYHLVFSPITALFATLVMVVFIGEAIREAFDPKVFSRLR